MKIYVNSCGVSQKHDYCWVEEHNNILEEPEVVKNVQYLIQSEAHSVVLTCDKNRQLLLLVTGIIASSRDFRNRAIRISVAWVVEKSDEQENKKDVQYLRQITASILMDKLISDIERQVEVIEGQECGFKVDFNKLENLVGEKLEDEGSKLEKNYQQNSIQTISDKTKYSDFKKKIAEELKKYCLPENNEVFVVTTGIKSKSVLTQANVWRGLSSLIDQDENNANNPASQNNIYRNIRSRIQHFINSPLQNFFVIVLIISLSLNGLLLQHWIVQDREIKNIKFTNERLEKQKQETDKKIQETDKKIEELYYSTKAKK